MFRVTEINCPQAAQTGLQQNAVNLTLHNLVVSLSTAMFNIHKRYVLPTQCIYVFCVVLRTNSDYFTVQH
jgi:hypothetical protein